MFHPISLVYMEWAPYQSRLQLDPSVLCGSESRFKSTSSSGPVLNEGIVWPVWGGGRNGSGIFSIDDLSNDVAAHGMIS